MEKKTIIYSLTSRGLFSEIFNMLLAIVYAKLLNKCIIINTYSWNARIKKGWEDYFLPTIPCINSYYSYQLKIYDQTKIWKGNIYYNPLLFFQFHASYIANDLYRALHPKTLLGDEVFKDMHNINFVVNTDLKSLMASKIKDIYKYNSRTNQFIEMQRKIINLPHDYIGVHIRRGDKVTTHEMEPIDLNTYIAHILDLKFISTNVYVATDDYSLIDEVKKRLSYYGFNVFYNKCNFQTGFKESLFNAKNINERYADTMNTLLDIDILKKSKYFIGTYSSNMSRIIPLFLGFDKCLSLDVDWKI